MAIDIICSLASIHIIFFYIMINVIFFLSCLHAWTKILPGTPFVDIQYNVSYNHAPQKNKDNIFVRLSYTYFFRFCSCQFNLATGNTALIQNKFRKERKEHFFHTLLHVKWKYIEKSVCIGNRKYNRFKKKEDLYHLVLLVEM